LTIAIEEATLGAAIGEQPFGAVLRASMMR
jgi:hypothetical protein